MTEERKVYQAEPEEPSFSSDAKYVEVDLNMSEDRSFLTMRQDDRESVIENKSMTNAKNFRKMRETTQNEITV